MKILIAYDGSSGADAALADLHHAHLPPDTQALVLSVADVWLPPDSLAHTEAADPLAAAPPPVEAIAAINFQMHADAKRAIADADCLAFEAGEKLRRAFPAWQVSSEARADSPAWGVLAVADRWRPDLLVAGATGQSSTLDAWLVGTVSQKLVTKAHCTVRIGRGAHSPETLPRLLVGFDGSPDAHAAVATIATRSWPAGASVGLVTALNPRLRAGFAEGAITALHQSGASGADALDFVLHEAARAADLLREAGLVVTTHVREGEPRDVLLEEARRVQASAIFIGAKGLVGASGLQHLRRFFIGSSATAIVWRASCTVEVARSADRSSAEP